MSEYYNVCVLQCGMGSCLCPLRLRLDIRRIPTGRGAISVLLHVTVGAEGE
jgi:hypothetical protein